MQVHDKQLICLAGQTENGSVTSIVQTKLHENISKICYSSLFSTEIWATDLVGPSNVSLAILRYTYMYIDSTMPIKMSQRSGKES